jgi:hypothetical protein
MGCGAMKVACHDDYDVVTKNEQEFVKLVQMHLKGTHQKSASHAEIMAMSKHP